MKKFLDEHDIRRRHREPNFGYGKEEGDFTRFVSSHKEEVKRVVCSSHQFEDCPICSGGEAKSEDRRAEDQAVSMKIPYSHC